MNVVYEPRGRAREYSELACNLFTGCLHGCHYCYAPAIRRQSLTQWSSSPEARKDIIAQLSKDCAKLSSSGEHADSWILFCFMTDPYQSDSLSPVTRAALQCVGQHGLKAQVLTKGGMRACRDFDVLKQYGFKFGSTIVFFDDAKRAEWEPGASPILDRIEAVKEAHRQGIYTWVSIEPIIDADEALKVIDALTGHVDLWKVGKINHNKAVESSIDWASLLGRLEKALKGNEQNYYIKKDLRAFAG